MPNRPALQGDVQRQYRRRYGIRDDDQQPPSSGGGAPVDGSFVLYGPDGRLTNSRVLAGAAPITVVDSGVPGGAITVGHAASGVTPTTYGDASHFPVVTVDANGHVTAASQNAVPAGLTSPLTTKGDIWTYGGANARQAIGTNGMVPVADSAQANGWSWIDPTLSGSSPNLKGIIPRWYEIQGTSANAWLLPSSSAWSLVGTLGPETADWTTNWLSMQKSLLQTTAVAGASAEYYVTSGRKEFALTTVNAYTGGWYFRARVGVSTAVANGRCFFGFRATAGGSFGNVQPSAQINIFGIGSDAGDANLSMIRNDGAGGATKNSLGANFPALTSATDMYDIILWAAAGQVTAANWAIRHIFTGAVAQGTETTDLPAANVGTEPRIWINNGATAAAAILGFTRVYAQADY